MARLWATTTTNLYRVDPMTSDARAPYEIPALGSDAVASPRIRELNEG